MDLITSTSVEMNVNWAANNPELFVEHWQKFFRQNTNVVVLTAGANTIKLVGNPKQVTHPFKLKDMVRYSKFTSLSLHCSTFQYSYAVVVSENPLVLASADGDMRWESTLQPEFLEKIGVVTEANYDKVKHRAER